MNWMIRVQCYVDIIVVISLFYMKTELFHLFILIVSEIQKPDPCCIQTNISEVFRIEDKVK